MWEKVAELEGSNDLRMVGLKAVRFAFFPLGEKKIDNSQEPFVTK